MVAGTDPYAFEGIENKAQPHVRPSGEGGCGNQDSNVIDEEQLWDLYLSLTYDLIRCQSTTLYCRRNNLASKPIIQKF
jgi:hypothetical protein